ncbi:G protein pathway suppressor 2 [Parasteatoda tepidariorum]|uniref:G protein pathway suppressor 2 n=1 Tax=Parasteatoda tepidariorum TaxID=114398 RepID=A0A2L2XYB5_PARTP|nr:G protein pathway suppressor 2 [Parasteatoda tepidariorum]XP_042902874.1 G protein pathway suppressor 2 [Parasteatoda tepidariorum]
MPALIERPKMSLAMWAALKSHIMKQREKKKQELEADAVVEQLRREQEKERKQNAMTLEGIKEQITEYEKRLLCFKNMKHELFLSLKRVLNDDEVRRNEEIKEANEIVQVNNPYQNQNVPVGAANLYLLGGNRVMNRNSGMYKVGNAPQMQQNVNGAVKRPRSPSPPPTSNYSQGYNYKAHVTAYGQTYSIPHPSGQYPSQEQAKHLAAANYHVSHLPQTSYVGGLPPQIDHPSQKASNLQEEKYYIQQTGSISAGYPIRSQPQLAPHLSAPHHSSTPPHQSAFYQKVKAIREYERAEGMRFEHATQSDPNAPIRKEELMRRSMNNDGHK